MTANQHRKKVVDELKELVNWYASITPQKAKDFGSRMPEVDDQASIAKNMLKSAKIMYTERSNG